MEIPEHVLGDVLRKGSEDAKVKVPSSLQKVSANAIEQALSYLKDGVSSHLQIAVLHIPQPLKGFPCEILQAVAGRLKHKDWQVRQAAVKALGRQAALPREILQAVASRLEDKNKHVREAAVRALGRQAALPCEILQAVAGRLEDEDGDVREAAVHALGGQAALPPEILIRYAESFYKVWLRRSFDEYFSCYIGDEIYIHTSDGFKAIHSDQIDRFREAIQGVRKKLRIPWL
jgi:HEAT repeat protein